MQRLLHALQVFAPRSDAPVDPIINDFTACSPLLCVLLSYAPPTVDDMKEEASLLFTAVLNLIFAYDTSENGYWSWLNYERMDKGTEDELVSLGELEEQSSISKAPSGRVLVINFPTKPSTLVAVSRAFHHAQPHLGPLLIIHLYHSPLLTAKPHVDPLPPNDLIDPRKGPPSPGESIGSWDETGGLEGSGTLGALLVGTSGEGQPLLIGLTTEQVVSNSAGVQRPSEDDLRAYIERKKKFPPVKGWSEIEIAAWEGELRAVARSFGRVHTRRNSQQPWVRMPSPLRRLNGFEEQGQFYFALDYALVNLDIHQHTQFSSSTGTSSPPSLTLLLSSNPPDPNGLLSNRFIIPPTFPRPGPQMGDPVELRGRSSGLIRGSIVDVFYGGVKTQRGAGLTCEYAFVGRRGGAVEGDSGSVVISAEDREPLGLFFAGGDSLSFFQSFSNIWPDMEQTSGLSLGFL